MIFTEFFVFQQKNHISLKFSFIHTYPDAGNTEQKPTDEW